MSAQEREQYRASVREAKGDSSQGEVRRRHRERMRERARQRGVELREPDGVVEKPRAR